MIICKKISLFVLIAALLSFFILDWGIALYRSYPVKICVIEDGMIYLESATGNQKFYAYVQDEGNWLSSDGRWMVFSIRNRVEKYWILKEHFGEFATDEKGCGKLPD